MARWATSVSGISENYLRNYIYMTEHTYETGMGVPAEKNVLLLRLTETGAAEKTDLGNELAQRDRGGQRSELHSKHQRCLLTGHRQDRYDCGGRDSQRGALALVILYNHEHQHLRARQRCNDQGTRLHRQRVYAYINRESVLLSLIGAAFGLVLGVFHRFAVVR